MPRRFKIARFLLELAPSTYSSVVRVEKFGYRLGRYMYKCYKCGKVVPREKLLEGSSMMCSCGSRIFMKVRPQRVKRVSAI